MKVLLVDDDYLDQKAIGLCLCEAYPDLELETRGNGRGLTELLESENFDVLLIDYRMPGNDGLKVLEAITDDPLSFPAAIMLSGMGNEAVAVSAMKSGALDYMSKDSVTPDILKLSIDSAIEKHKLKVQLAEHQSKLERMALSDELTNVGNRAAFNAEASRRIAQAARSQRRFTLLMIDLNDFKRINDSLGHAAGDQVLCDVAQLLGQQCRAGDAVFRVGGDEFAVLAELSDCKNEVRFLCRRMINCLDATTIGPDGRAIGFSASVGAAVFPDDTHDLIGLMQIADNDMYLCKRMRRASLSESRAA